MQAVEIQRENGEVVTLNENEVMHIVNEWSTNGTARVFVDQQTGVNLEDALSVDGKVNIRTIKE